jgi:hypothetical protein
MKRRRLKDSELTFTLTGASINALARSVLRSLHCALLLRRGCPRVGMHTGRLRSLASQLPRPQETPAGGRVAGTALDRESRRRFADQGFLVLPGALSTAEVARYRAMADALVEQARGYTGSRADGAGYSFSLAVDPVIENHGSGGFLHKVQGVSTAEPRFVEIARHPSILPVLQELLGTCLAR